MLQHGAQGADSQGMTPVRDAQNQFMQPMPGDRADDGAGTAVDDDNDDAASKVTLQTVLGRQSFIDMRDKDDEKEERPDVHVHGLNGPDHLAAKAKEKSSSGIPASSPGQHSTQIANGDPKGKVVDDTAHPSRGAEPNQGNMDDS